MRTLIIVMRTSLLVSFCEIVRSLRALATYTVWPAGLEQPVDPRAVRAGLHSDRRSGEALRELFEGVASVGQRLLDGDLSLVVQYTDRVAAVA